MLSHLGEGNHTFRATVSGNRAVAKAELDFRARHGSRAERDGYRGDTGDVAGGGFVVCSE